MSHHWKPQLTDRLSFLKISRFHSLYWGPMCHLRNGSFRLQNGSFVPEVTLLWFNADFMPRATSHQKNNWPAGDFPSTKFVFAWNFTDLIILGWKRSVLVLTNNKNTQQPSRFSSQKTHNNPKLRSIHQDHRTEMADHELFWEWRHQPRSNSITRSTFTGSVPELTAIIKFRWHGYIYEIKSTNRSNCADNHIFVNLRIHTYEQHPEMWSKISILIRKLKIHVDMSSWWLVNLAEFPPKNAIK